jgi:hypothetical protein
MTVCMSYGRFGESGISVSSVSSSASSEIGSDAYAGGSLRLFDGR